MTEIEVLETPKPKKRPAFFADPDVSEERKAAARKKGGEEGGRKRRYVQGTSVPLESLDDVLAGLGEVVANLKGMDIAVGTMNSLIRAYQVASACYLAREERDEIRAEIDALKAVMGFEE